MTFNCIYPAVAGRPGSLFIGVFVLFWRRIMSLLTQVIPLFRRVGEGVEERGRRDLDSHVTQKLPVEGEREGEWFEKPLHVNKMTVRFQDMVTEFHDSYELISHVHECVVDSGEEKEGLGDEKDDHGFSMGVSVSETIAKAGSGIQLYKAHLVQGLEEEEEEVERPEEDQYVGTGPDQDTSISGGGDELGISENGPQVVSVPGDLVYNDIPKIPCSETGQIVSDTEEPEEKLHSHMHSDEHRDGDAFVEDGNIGTNGYAVQDEPDAQGQEEETKIISNEDDLHLRFPNEEEVATSAGHDDAFIQNTEFETNRDTELWLDDCNDISENPCPESAQKDEPNESWHEEEPNEPEHGDVQLHGDVRDENSEVLEDGIASFPSEYEDDYDEDEDHDFFIQKLKSEIRRLKGPNLSVIPEESESDLFDSSTWDSFSEESLRESPMEDCSTAFRTLEQEEEEESVEVFYEKYTERMRYFDMLNYQQIYTMGLVQISHETLKTSKPQGVAKILRNGLTNKSQSTDESKDFMMRLQQGLETVYVGQTCLSWEALHWQYKMFRHMVLSGPEHDFFYDYVADQFQQFQVVLQRFLENEEFEGPRVLNYVKNRCVLRSFLHVPPLKGSMKAEALPGTGTSMVTATQLVNMMEESIVLFSDFVKAEKIKSTMPSQLLLNFLCGHQELEDPNDSGLLRAVRKQLHSKELQVRELQRRGRCIIKRLDPRTGEGLEILMALVDIKLVSRVLKMSRITTDQLQWCQKKLNKLSVSDRRVLHRKHSTVLFPI